MLRVGVEVLVADLIRSIAAEPTVGDVAVSGLVVVIRTLLSFSLEVEIEGVPVARGAVTAVSRTTRARTPCVR